MPISVRPATGPPPPPGPVSSDLATATWTAPDDTLWQLTNVDGGWFTLDEVAGLGAAPIEHTLDVNPRGGATVRHTQPQQRYITWPLYVEGDSHSQFLSRWRQLAQAFTVTSRMGPGVLRIIRPNGTAREISAYYDGGFAEEPGQGWRHATPVLTLLCEDPYWQDTATRTETRKFADEGSEAADFYSPFLSLVSGQVIGQTTITNPGAVKAWPAWTITGPASLITASNSTTGESFELDPNWDGGGPLGAGQQITITTDPPTVRGPAGDVWTGALNWPNAVLWGLTPGVNDLNLQVDGADSGTQISLAWRPRHQTP